MKVQLKNDDRITVLMLSWRDIRNPYMGGAEVYTHEILKRLNDKKYRIVHLSPVFEGSPKSEIIDGILYLRCGSTRTIIGHAISFYNMNKKKIDIVIDQCNAFRFFSSFWVSKKKRIFLEFQLYRELWKVMAKFPISTIGKIMETPMLKLNCHDYAITESDSVRQEMLQVGFEARKLSVIPIGLGFEPWDEEKFLPKEEHTFIYVGRCVKSKGINDLLKAFGKVKKQYTDAKLWIVGNCRNEMLENLLPIIREYNLTYGKDRTNDIVFWGFVSEEKKLELQSRATVQVFPSMREGWGIIITEAAAVGTPSIVYNVTGCCDAVDYGNAGYLCKTNAVEELQEKMESALADKITYTRMQRNAHEFSKKFNWDVSAKMFDEKLMQVQALKKVGEYEPSNEGE